VGKQPRPRPPAAGSEEERIGNLRRELHEHIQEAREVTRELRAAEADADLARARLIQAAADADKASAAAIREQFEAAMEAARKVTGEFNTDFRDTVAGLAGLPSGEALIDRITSGLAGVFGPIVDEAIGQAMEHRLGQLLELPGTDTGGRRRSG
jgi:hypothetical protein